MFRVRNTVSRLLTDSWRFNRLRVRRFDYLIESLDAGMEVYAFRQVFYFYAFEHFVLGTACLRRNWRFCCENFFDFHTVAFNYNLLQRFEPPLHRLLRLLLLSEWVQINTKIQPNTLLKLIWNFEQSWVAVLNFRDLVREYDSAFYLELSMQLTLATSRYVISRTRFLSTGMYVWRMTKAWVDASDCGPTDSLELDSDCGGSYTRCLCSKTNTFSFKSGSSCLVTSLLASEAT